MVVTTYKMSDIQVDPSIDYANSQDEALKTHRRITQLGGIILNVEVR